MENTHPTPDPTSDARASANSPEFTQWIQSIFSASGNSSGDPRENLGVLDSVIRSTVAARHSAPQLSSPEPNALLDALRALAQSRRGEPFSADPIAVEMIHVVLTAGLPERQKTPLWQRVASEVAATLCQDPQIVPRLESMWKQLGETP